MGVRNSFLFLSLVWLFAGSAFAGNIPECRDGSRVLEVNNHQVLDWKKNTANQFKARAYVEGHVTKVTMDRESHYQYEIRIGNGADETLEVIYNKAFGAIPDAKAGMAVQACGDYITSTAQAGHYPPSPSGAIIHWVHKNSRGGSHEDGFMVMDGTLCGHNPAAGAGRGRRGFNPFDYLGDNEAAFGAPQFAW